MIMRSIHWVLGIALAVGFAGCKDRTDRESDMAHRTTTIRETSQDLGTDRNVNRGAADDGLAQNDSSIGQPPSARPAIDQAKESERNIEVDEKTVRIGAVTSQGKE